MEEARTIITLYRYNEMRECEDIQVIQLWIALQDFTSYVTSFQISQLHNQFPNQLQQKQPPSISVRYPSHSTQSFIPYKQQQPASLLLTTTLYASTTYYVVDRSAHQAMLQYSTCYMPHHYPYIMYILPNIRYRYVSLHLQRDTGITVFATMYADTYRPCPLLVACPLDSLLQPHSSIMPVQKRTTYVTCTPTSTYVFIRVQSRMS